MPVIVVRPGIPGIELVTRLEALGISAMHCPLISFQPLLPTAVKIDLLGNLSNYTMIIALSPRAVSFIQPWLPDDPHPWPISVEYYAVGAATAHALQQQCGRIVQYPIGASSSEDLLSMPRFSRVADEVILLLRGQGGRRHLVNQLRKRGATVNICHCYRRVPIGNYQLEQRDFWRQSEVNCLVVTSGGLLRQLYAVVPCSARSGLFRSILVVVSIRLAKLARRLGWELVVVAHASDNVTLVEVVRQQIAFRGGSPG